MAAIYFDDDALREAIRNEVRSFLHSQMGQNPTTTDVDVHSASVVVVMQGILAEGEKSAAHDRRMQELIVRTYSSAFRAVGTLLESRVGTILGRTIDTSSFLLDVPQTARPSY